MTATHKHHDFEDISLNDMPIRRYSSGAASCPGSDNRSSTSSVSSGDERHSISNVSTPTLLSDTSSQRSSMSSPSILGVTESHFARMTSPAGMTPPLGHQLMRHNSIPAKLDSFTDKTSMASLSRLPSFKARSRKQREMDYENDKEEEFWPADGLMFNVPMSPALYNQQRLKQLQKPPARGSAPRSRLFASAGPASGPLGPPNTEPPARLRPHSSPRPGKGLPSIEESAAQRQLSQVGLEGLDPDSQVLTLAYSMSDTFDFGSGLETPTETPKQRALSMPSLQTGLATPESPMSNSRRTSLTRPEHLPPKTPDEERKHMDAYGKLMVRAVEAERKRQADKEQQEVAKREQQAQDAVTWQLWLSKPNTLSKKRISELYWRGIPEKVRGSVWLAKVGNQLGAQLAAQKLGGDTAQIVKDCALVYPELGIFGENRPLHGSLLHLAQAALGFYTQLIYQPALLHLCGVLLLQLDVEQAFIVLVNLLHNSLPLAVLTGDEQTSTAHYASYYKVFRAKFQSLNKHFTEIRLGPQQYLDPMIAAVFGDRLEPDLAAHIIDIYLFEGDGFLLIAALGLVSSCESRLYQSRNEVFAELSSKYDIGDERLFKFIARATH